MCELMKVILDFLIDVYQDRKESSISLPETYYDKEHIKPDIFNGYRSGKVFLVEKNYKNVMFSRLYYAMQLPYEM